MVQSSQVSSSERDGPLSSLSAGQALTDHRSVNITWSQTDPAQALAEKLAPNMIITQTKLFYFLGFIMLTCLVRRSCNFVETQKIHCFVSIEAVTMHYARCRSVFTSRLNNNCLIQFYDNN